MSERRTAHGAVRSGCAKRRRDESKEELDGLWWITRRDVESLLVAAREARRRYAKPQTDVEISRAPSSRAALINHQSRLRAEIRA